jgi:hypothetical protein
MTGIDINEIISFIKPLGIFILEIVVYSFFIFKFYRFLASRDIITVDMSKYKNLGLRVGRLFSYLLQHIIIYPLIIFIWFAVLFVFLGFLGKNQSTESILLISIALVSAIRVTAYYNEDLSRDLAKMLPFTLLGIYLVDQSYFQVPLSLKLLTAIPDYWLLLLYYLVFIIVLEFVLKIIYSIVMFAIRPPKAAAE